MIDQVVVTLVCLSSIYTDLWRNLLGQFFWQMNDPWQCEMQAYDGRTHLWIYNLYILLLTF